MSLVLNRVAHPNIVVLLDEDPDLGAGISEEQWPVVRRRAVAGAIDLRPPGWDPALIRERATDGWVGLLVVDGILVRRVRVGRRWACELFGPGDVIRPWDADGEYEPLPITVDWLVLKAVRLAVLDTEFSLRVARWPSVNGRIVSRVARRARYLAVTHAVTHLPRAYARLLITFWLLAERWGKVTVDGVYVTLPVTHEMLAMLIGAQRPTVTIALQRLSRSGFLARERRDRWLLTNKAIETLRHPESLDLVDDQVPA